MKSRNAVALLICAALAGVVAGSLVLPRWADRQTVWPNPVAGTASSSVSPNRSNRPSPESKPTGSGSPEVPPVPFGSSRLVQTDDFFQTGLALKARPTGDTGDRRLTGCTGDRTMKDLMKGKVTNNDFAEAGWYDPHPAPPDVDHGTGISESVSRAHSAAAARQTATSFTGRLNGCRYSEAGWHLQMGRPEVVHQHSGTGWIYVIDDVDGTYYGGVVVVCSGKNVGVLELTDARLDGTATEDLLQSLAAAALSRIQDR